MRYHLEKRHKRSWTIIFDLGKGIDGKRQRKAISVEGTKAQAEAEAQKMMYEMAAGVYVEPVPMTTAEWLTAWLEEKQSGIASRTYETYESIVNYHLIPALGHIPLQKLTPAHIAKYKVDTLQAVSPKSVANHLTLLGSILRLAKRRKLIRDNPAEEVDKPRFEAVKYHVYTEKEIKAILDTTAQLRPAMQPIIFLVLRTGMRLGEVLALRWGNVDLAEGIIYVREKVAREKKKGLVFGPPKAGSAGAVAISGVVVEMLKVIKPGEAGPDTLVFPTKRGTPYDVKNVSAYFREIREKAGLPVGRFHDLRHTHASLLLDEGEPLTTVQERLRHKQLSTTANIYGHSVAGRQRKAAEKLELRLGQRSGNEGEHNEGKDDGKEGQTVALTGPQSE